MRAGQALVVILLVLAVAVTVGVAIVSRSVIEVGVSTTQEEAARALAAAEAGIEAKLAGGTTIAEGQTYSLGQATYAVTTATAGSGEEYTSAEGLVAGEAATLFLADHDANGNLALGVNQYRSGLVRVCWGQAVEAGSASAPALEAMLYYTDGAASGVGRNAYDPNAGRRGENNFASAESDGSNCPAGAAFVFSRQINFTAATSAGGLGVPASAQALFLRLRLLYNGETAHVVGVKGQNGATFPSQGRVITAVGTAAAGTGEVATRKIRFIDNYPDPWPFADSAVWSGGGLTK